MLFKKIFKKDKPIIAMLHVFEGEKFAQLSQALQDLVCLQPYVDGVIVENYGCGYLDNNLANSEMKEVLTAITEAVVRESSIPVGVNVLPNDYGMAFEICGKTGASFVQLDHVTGEFINCSSVAPGHLQEIRNQYPNVALLGGIHPKYYQLVDKTVSIADSAYTAKSLTDAIVITGEYTGGATSIEEICSVKEIIGSHPLVVGSGVTSGNVIEQLSVADGAIVGTAFKRNGVNPGNPIVMARVKNLMDKVSNLRNI